jgi:hypothetical protein
MAYRYLFIHSFVRYTYIEENSYQGPIKTAHLSTQLFLCKEAFHSIKYDYKVFP